MRKLLSIALNLMLFQTLAFAQHSRNWEGTDVPGHIQASFEKLQGTQTFKIVPSSQNKRVIKYAITCQAGQLAISIKSGSSVILSRKTTGTLKDSIIIVKNPEKPMKVNITGSSAKGSFDINYSM